jgi:hypothetical protein
MGHIWPVITFYYCLCIFATKFFLKKNYRLQRMAKDLGSSGKSLGQKFPPPCPTASAVMDNRKAAIGLAV